LGEHARTVSLGKPMGIAAACAVVSVLVTALGAWLTDSTGAAAWFVGPAATVVGAMLAAVVQAYASRTEPAYPDGPARRRPPTQPVRGTSLPVALVVIVLVIGVGGFAVAAGARFAYGWVTGNEAGTDRLLRPARGTGSGVTLTVTSFSHTRHFTRVGVTARNANAQSAALPLFKNCILTSGGGGRTIEADDFRSDWSGTLAPGVPQSGTIVFKGHMPNRSRRASLTFAQVYVLGGGALTVPGIRLRRVSSDS
jgi:hypothetical protein